MMLLSLYAKCRHVTWCIFQFQLFFLMCYSFSAVSHTPHTISSLHTIIAYLEAYMLPAKPEFLHLLHPLLKHFFFLSWFFTSLFSYRTRPLLSDFLTLISILPRLGTPKPQVASLEQYPLHCNHLLMAMKLNFSIFLFFYLITGCIWTFYNWLFSISWQTVSSVRIQLREGKRNAFLSWSLCGVLSLISSIKSLTLIPK